MAGPEEAGAGKPSRKKSCHPAEALTCVKSWPASTGQKGSQSTLKMRVWHPWCVGKVSTENGTYLSFTPQTALEGSQPAWAGLELTKHLPTCLQACLDVLYSLTSSVRASSSTKACVNPTRRHGPGFSPSHSHESTGFPFTRCKWQWAADHSMGDPPASAMKQPPETQQGTGAPCWGQNRTGFFCENFYFSDYQHFPPNLTTKIQFL